MQEFLPLDVRLLHMPALACGEPISTALRLPKAPAGKEQQQKQLEGLCLVLIVARARPPHSPLVPTACMVCIRLPGRS